VPQGLVEVVERRTKVATEVPIAGVAAWVQKSYQSAVISSQ
jgi:hypothetical protein